MATRNRYYRGPSSDHFDGDRFFLAGHRRKARTRDLLKWQFSGERKPWPAWIDDGPGDQPPPRVDGEMLRASFVGHSTVLIQTSGVNILTDPFFSLRASPVQWAGPKRVRKPGVALDRLPQIDLVLLSHNHYDHFDVAALRRLARLYDPLILTPHGNGAILKRRVRGSIRYIELDWHDDHYFTDGVTVTLTPSRHWSKRNLSDQNHALWGAFVVTTPAGPIYFAADTGYGDGSHFRDVRARFGPPRLALLPIGAYEPRQFLKNQHMNPDDAVAAHCDLDASWSLAIHHSTVQLTHEGIDEPPVALQAALRQRAIPPERFRVLMPGEHWFVPAAASPRFDDMSSTRPWALAG